LYNTEINNKIKINVCISADDISYTAESFYSHEKHSDEQRARP